MRRPRGNNFGVGARGSTQRRAIVVGIFALGLVSVCILGYVLQQPVLQVYWAVYARLYPLKDHASSKSPLRGGT